MFTVYVHHSMHQAILKTGPGYDIHYIHWCMAFSLSMCHNSCDINLQDEQGKSALHYAVLANRADITQVLLSKGASVVIKDNRNKTPLQYSKEMVSCTYMYTHKCTIGYAIHSEMVIFPWTIQQALP